jgi:hypothetical protein
MDLTIWPGRAPPLLKALDAENFYQSGETERNKHNGSHVFSGKPVAAGIARRSKSRSARILEFIEPTGTYWWRDPIGQFKRPSADNFVTTTRHQRNCRISCLRL